jgi:hypothetical protein
LFLITVPLNTGNKTDTMTLKAEELETLPTAPYVLDGSLRRCRGCCTEANASQGIVKYGHTIKKNKTGE